MQSRLFEPEVFDDALGGQAPGDHGSGHAGAGMRAGADEVEIAIARVPVRWAEAGHLGELMREAVRGALEQVIALAPGKRRKGLFELDVRRQVGDAERPQAAEYVLAGGIADEVPILFAAIAEVPDRDDGDKRVLTGRRHRG